MPVMRSIDRILAPSANEPITAICFSLLSTFIADIVLAFGFGSWGMPESNRHSSDVRPVCFRYTNPPFFEPVAVTIGSFLFSYQRIFSVLSFDAFLFVNEIRQARC